MTKEIASPLLGRCPPSLPASAYLSETRFQAERQAIFAREWVHVGRLADLPLGRMRPHKIAGRGVLLLREPEGCPRAFLNLCRHRGAELCDAEREIGRLIRCRYHAWAYTTDGRLASTGPATPTADFRPEDHGLLPVALTEWNGFLYLSLAADPPPFAPDLGPKALDPWGAGGLVTGHRRTVEVAANWKVVWENYNECLHCPGIHPALSRLVPVYSRGIMSPAEAPHSDPAPDPAPGPALRDGAQSWTVSGRACGPDFPGLSEAEREAGHLFVTLYPSHYIAAHRDYIRSVTVTPLAPGRTRLTAEWLFPAATLAAPDFDLSDVVDFAATVMAEDAAACEMNQRGLASAGEHRGTLMPEEFDIARFHEWVETRLAKAATGASRDAS